MSYNIIKIKVQKSSGEDRCTIYEEQLWTMVDGVLKRKIDYEEWNELVYLKVEQLSEYMFDNLIKTKNKIDKMKQKMSLSIDKSIDKRKASGY